MSSHLYKALVVISFVNYGNSVPPEYCLHPLNKDDCSLQPRPVFSYYPPGSRCEIETWRGCPTPNMFDDEVSCSDLCIGILYRKPDQMLVGEASRLPMFSEIMMDREDNPCYKPFNDDDCGKKVELKYFFSNDLCVRTQWRGCSSPNLFDDLQTCIKVCNPVTYFEPEIKEAIAELPVDEVKDMDKLIDDVIEEETYLTELPMFTYKPHVSHNKVGQVLSKINNVTNTTSESSEEDENDEINEVTSDRDEKEEEEETAEQETAEQEIENKEEKVSETLADDEESVEGSLEEVFTLS